MTCLVCQGTVYATVETPQGALGDTTPAPVPPPASDGSALVPVLVVGGGLALLGLAAYAHRRNSDRRSTGGRVCARCGYAERRAGEVRRGLCPACSETGTLVDVAAERPPLVLELQEANLPRRAAGAQMSLLATGGRAARPSRRASGGGVRTVSAQQVRHIVPALASADEDYQAGRMSEAQARAYVRRWNLDPGRPRAILEQGEIRTRARPGPHGLYLLRSGGGPA